MPKDIITKSKGIYRGWNHGAPGYRCITLPLSQRKPSIHEYFSCCKDLIEMMLTLSKTSPGFYVSVVDLQVFWKQCGKREIYRNMQFLFFPVFSTYLENVLPFLSNLKLLSANSFSLEDFLPIWRTFCHFHRIWNCRLQILSVWKSLKFVIWERVKAY